MIRQACTHQLSLRFIIIALLAVIITSYAGYSHAKDIELNKPSAYESQLLTVPKLYVSIKSAPKLIYTPLTSTFTSQDVLFTNHIPDTDLNSGPDDIKKMSIESLLEKYGFNKAVENSLYFYTKKINERFLAQLKRMGKYLSQITEIFIEKNLPRELVFLPLIESGFNPYAYSPQKAAGLWQFIPGTAKKYGLKINWWVDERRDPVKATIAAAEYLSDLFEMFGSWNLALAAYNAGEGRILRALKKAKTEDFWVLRETRHIKKETKNYVPSYIAATAIALDPEGFGFENVSYNTPLEYDEIVINSPMSLTAVAKFTEVDVAYIKELNPELRQWCTPPNVTSYTLRLPVGTKEMFLFNLSNAKDDELLDVQTYTVKKGDTVKKIAGRFGVPSQVITDLNSLDKNSLLKAGSKILVPSKIAAPTIKKKNKTSKNIKSKGKVARKSYQKTST